MAGKQAAPTQQDLDTLKQLRQEANDAYAARCRARIALRVWMRAHFDEDVPEGVNGPVRIAEAAHQAAAEAVAALEKRLGIWDVPECYAEEDRALAQRRRDAAEGGL